MVDHPLVTCPFEAHTTAELLNSLQRFQVGCFDDSVNDWVVQSEAGNRIFSV